MRRAIKNFLWRFWHSWLGVQVVRIFILATRHRVLSERTLGSLQFDAMRLQARIELGSKRYKPPFSKLHFGCGTRVVSGWTNADVAGAPFRVDLAAGNLPWNDASFDAMVSQHVIEHLDLQSELLPLLHELRRVAKPGAELWLSCPDLGKRVVVMLTIAEGI